MDYQRARKEKASSTRSERFWLSLHMQLSASEKKQVQLQQRRPGAVPKGHFMREHFPLVARAL
jgi:hypothetical protein